MSMARRWTIGLGRGTGVRMVFGGCYDGDAFISLFLILQLSSALALHCRISLISSSYSIWITFGRVGIGAVGS